MRKNFTFKTAILSLAVLFWSALAMGQTANFTAATTSGCSPLVVSFQNQSTNSTSWAWDFGNGATSTLENPSTTYFSPGTYTVTLTATNASGSNTMTRTAYITIYGKPAVNFIVNDSLACFPHHAQFTDLSTPAANTSNVAWLWDFGDGTQGFDQNPAHTYNNSGNYTVTVKVTNDKGCYGVFNKQKYINIAGGIVSDFSNTFPTVCRPPYNVSFTNNTTGPGTLTWAWDFGDGSAVETTKDPVHVYTKPGNFIVTMTVKSSVGCSDTLRKQGTLNIEDTKTSVNLPDSLCIKAEIPFLNSSTPAPLSSVWTFGNGDGSTEVSPIYAYSTPGTYTVKLKNTYQACTDSASKTIKVLPRPSAQFTAVNTKKCAPDLTVTFTDQSLNAVSWRWDFGDQSPESTQKNPTHTYTKYGDFTVRLIVTNASGCTDTMTKVDLVLIERPQISFPNMPALGCLPFTVPFFANIQTLDNVTSYSWNFGDGSPKSSSAAPPHTYTARGNYDVTLTITTSGGCTETFTYPGAVKAGERPTVDFKATPNPVCAFQPVQFTDLSSQADEWQWNFGDGLTSRLKDPIHEFSDTGLLPVKLIVRNNGCLDSLEKPLFIQVNAPIARFNYSTTCDNRRRFAFRDSSILSPTGNDQWSWDFGDGSPAVTNQNPVHTFPDFGTYKVTLTVTSGSCSHSQTRTIAVITDNTPIVSDISSGCRNASFNFKASNSPNLVRWEWFFGDGTYLDSKVTNTANQISHSYPNSGLYNVTVVTTDIYGCQDTVPGKVIKVFGALANFSADTRVGCKSLNTTFKDLSTPDGFSPILTWTWDFGDSTGVKVLTGPPFAHNYTQAGHYEVKLTVKDSAGCSDTKSFINYIVVSDPQVGFTSADTLSCPGSNVRFQNTSSGEPFTSIWDFGDNSTSSDQSPVHQYDSSGKFPVKLTIKDIYNCTASISAPAFVNIDQPKAAYTVNDSISSCTPFEVNFTNQSKYFISSNWDLGGGTSTLTDPTQFYNSPGNFPIRLIVTSYGGCTDTANGQIQVFDTVGSRITYLPLNGCKPLNLDLEAFSPGPMKYNWDFGDGVLVDDSLTTIQHLYRSFGNFVPKVIMTDPAGCIIPVAGIDTVNIIGATAKFGLDTRFFCDSGMVSFIDSTTFNDPLTSYTWDFGDGASSGLTNPSHQYTAPGIYDVMLHVTTQSNCLDTFKIANAVKVVASPLISILGDTVICVNDDLRHAGIFERVDTSIVKWSWQFPNGQTANVQNPSAQKYGTAGLYTVTTVAENSSGCRDTATLGIRVNPLPQITVPSTLTMQSGFPVTIPATYTASIDTFTWTPSTTLDCSDCPQPVASPKFDTKYTISVIDTNGCRNSSVVQVIVICKNANVFVPNTFSPNGDGANDIFFIRGKGLDRVKSLRIFNRWGEVVFEQSNFPVNNAAYGWNGRYRGKDPIADVYIYQVEVFCENSQIIRFEGNVALIQ